MNAPTRENLPAFRERRRREMAAAGVTDGAAVAQHRGSAPVAASPPAIDPFAIVADFKRARRARELAAMFSPPAVVAFFRGAQPAAKAPDGQPAEEEALSPCGRLVLAQLKREAIDRRAHPGAVANFLRNTFARSEPARERK